MRYLVAWMYNGYSCSTPFNNLEDALDKMWFLMEFGITASIHQI